MIPFLYETWMNLALLMDYLDSWLEVLGEMLADKLEDNLSSKLSIYLDIELSYLFKLKAQSF